LFDKNAEENHATLESTFMAIMEQCNPKGVFAQKKGIPFAKCWNYTCY